MIEVVCESCGHVGIMEKEKDALVRSLPMLKCSECQVKGKVRIVVSSGTTTQDLIEECVQIREQIDALEERYTEIRERLKNSLTKPVVSNGYRIYINKRKIWKYSDDLERYAQESKSALKNRREEEQKNGIAIIDREVRTLCMAKVKNPE